MPNFNIVIGATDKATAVINKINDRMAKVTRPLEDTRESFKRFETAVADNPIAKGLGHLSGAALGVAQSIGKIAAPVAALTSVGSIAGISMLADRWAKFGRSVTYSAQAIGISTTQLQQYQGIATLSGISTDGMVSSLNGLGTTMNDARWGRNQGALMMLQRIGIGLKKTKDGAWDVAGTFKAINRVMNNPDLKSNPQAQAKLADVLGVSASLPLLRQSTKAFDDYGEAQKKLGYVSSPQDIDNANKFAQSLAGLQISAEGLGQSIMDKAMPALNPFIDDLSNWISTIRQPLSNQIGDWIKTTADYISKVNWKEFGSGITGFFSNAKGSASELKLVLDDVVASLKAVGDTYNATKYVFRRGGAFTQLTGDAGQFTSADNAAYSAEHGDDAKFKAREKAMLGNGALLTLDAFKKQMGFREWLKTDTAVQNDWQDYLDNNVAKSYLDPGSVKGVPPESLDSFHQRNQIAPYDPSQGAATVPGKSVAYDPSKVAWGVGNSNAAVKFFESQGWTQAQAAGIAGNISLESGFDPGAVGDHGNAYGLFQFHKDRQEEFAKWAGHSIVGSSGDEQMRFLNYEITQGKEKAGGAMLRQASTPYAAGAVFSHYIERPAHDQESASARGNQAALIAQNSANSAPQGPYSAGAPIAKDSTVHVQIDLKNAPPGTTAKATTTGDAQAAPPRIGYSTVGVAAA